MYYHFLTVCHWDSEVRSKPSSWPCFSAIYAGEVPAMLFTGEVQKPTGGDAFEGYSLDAKYGSAHIHGLETEDWLQLTKTYDEAAVRKGAPVFPFRYFLRGDSRWFVGHWEY